MRLIHSALLLLVTLALPGLAHAELRLVMVEQPGCIHCKAWDDEVSAIYPLTEEGKAAPLSRIQLRAPLPKGMYFVRTAVFTPTFVLLQDGTEIGRIEGYPGEDFFWGLLGQIMDAQNIGSGSD